MSFINESHQTETSYTEIKEQKTHQFFDRLRKLGHKFWAYTEETDETNIKPFEGWQ
ncbi:MAG: hypothetical protein ABJH63_08880 [Rhizobiaceae bacterium]